MKLRRHHTNDLTAHTFQFDRTSDDGGIASKALFPQSVAQDNIIVFADGIFPGTERSPKFGLRSENRQQLCGNFRACKPHWFAKTSEIEFVTLGVGSDVHRVDLLAHGNERTLRISPGNANQFRGLGGKGERRGECH